MTTPLIILSILSFAFIFTLPNINPLSGNGWFEHSLHETKLVDTHHHNLNINSEHSGLIIQHFDKNYNLNEVEHHIHDQHDQAMFLSLLVAFIGILLSSLFYFFNKLSIEKATYFMKKVGLFNLSRRKFYIDSIYNNIIYKPFLWFCSLASRLDWNIYDQTFIDSIGRRTLDLSDRSVKADYDWLDQKIVDGSARLVEYFNNKLKHTQSGIIQNYLMAGILGIVIIALLFQQI